MTISSDTALLLEEEAIRINSPAFIKEDPVQFPRRFTDLRDIEIVAFLSAMIAWGNRKMICRDTERLLEIMNHEPYYFLQNGFFEEFPDEKNIHRTFFGRDLKYFLRGAKIIYDKYGSFEELSSRERVGESLFPAWELVGKIQNYMSEANGGKRCSQCFPTNLKTTALKRINMALRWLVRDDGIVDMGVWKSIPKSKLFIPLDVHVGNTARSLGILDRKSNDRKSVEMLTEVLRELKPEDPAFFDFALFGIGIESKKLSV